MTKVKVFSSKSATRTVRPVQVEAGRSLIGAVKCCCSTDAL